MIQKVVLVTAFILGVLGAYAQGPWSKEYDKDNIIIHTRDAGDIKFKEFKAEMVTSGTMEACVAVFLDYQTHNKFMYSLLDCQLVERNNSKDYYLHYMIDVPWPYNDRDMVVRAQFKKQSDKLVTLQMNSYPDKKPSDDYVRMRVTEGIWSFEQINSSQVKITYINKSDPSGNIPAWLANMFIIDGPKETLLGLEKRIPQYSSKVVSWLH
ncbi:MAG: hypothetical protein GY810_25595 [Aureispira sp.]|nr:hypothetical protein [Aureispira sp.]